MENSCESCCGSRVVAEAESSSSNSLGNSNRRERRKLEAYNEVLRRLKDSDIEEAHMPGFEDDLWIHFNRLPARYALDVNVERAEDVLRHKRFLQLATDPSNRPVFDVRLVQVPPYAADESTAAESLCSKAEGKLQAQRILPPPSFGSSPNLEALALESQVQADEDTSISGGQSFRPMHEITYSSDDKPKLLSQLTALLAEIGLNIQEAHAFSTTDGYSLDVFVVDGCPYEEIEEFRTSLEKELLKIEKQQSRTSTCHPFSHLHQSEQSRVDCELNHLAIPSDGKDVWEIDPRMLKFEAKIASGSYGDLYKGTYFSQEVAIKVLNPDRVNADLLKEFTQEVFIMRKVRHKNVVQFIGACTKPPTLCIITEFMSCGSLYDYLHKHKGSFKLTSLIRVALDISKGMNYLHQHNIIHRDLKAANLLMDENDVVKVADFGVARVRDQSGVMTAETGTYRWMAPEVIEHKPYDHKADVFSFGIVLWELLTGKLPYEYLTPLQAAVGVVQKGLRPTIPKNTHPKITRLLEDRCWQKDPASRPNFSEIIEILLQIAKEVGEDEELESGSREKLSVGFLSILRRG